LGNRGGQHQEPWAFFLFNCVSFFALAYVAYKTIRGFTQLFYSIHLNTLNWTKNHVGSTMFWPH
jgi:hypothetical protein